MVTYYAIVITNDAGDQLTLGNYLGDLHIIDIDINKQNRVGIANVTLDNYNDLYAQDFTDLNEIEIYILPEGATGDKANINDYYKRFAGEVEENTPATDKSRTVLMCKDYNNYLAQRTISGTWSTIDLGQLYYNVLAEKCPEFDISGINTSTGIIIDKIQADAQYINEFFDDLEREYAYMLRVDFDLVAQLIDTDNGSSNITLSEGDDGNVIDGSQNLKNSNVSRKNKVTVIGGNETITDFDEDQITWNTGDPTTIILSNKIDNLQWVKFDSVAVVENTDFELLQDGTVLKLLTITNGQTIDIRYDYLNPVWWAEQDPSASKIRELTVKDDTILTQDRAETVAKALLEKLGIKQTKGTVASDHIINEFSLLQTLELSNVQGFNGIFTITGYREQVKDYYKVTFTLTQVLDDTTRKLFDLLKDVDKLKNANSTTATIKDGFTLFDVLGLSESLTGFEQGIGTRLIFDHPTNSKFDSGYKMDDYGTTQTQFL